MKKFWQSFSYLNYILIAKTRYKVHSPFVYDLIEKVFRDKTHYEDYTKLNRLHRRYAHRKDRIEIMDFGSSAGNNEFVVNISTVGKVVRKRTHTKKQLELLYRISRYFHPETLLEFGTAAGISTLYLGKGSPKSKITTMEGCMGMASVARKNFIKRELNAEIEVGEFGAIIDHVLENIETLNMVFFDGNHRKLPTLEYFEKCAEKADTNSVFLFDDIHWSRGMQSAWNTIKKDKRVSVTIDLYWLGMVFFRDGIKKQDFVIRY